MTTAAAQREQRRRADGGIACDNKRPFVHALENLAAHDGGGVTGGRDGSAMQQHDMRREARHQIELMTDEQHRLPLLGDVIRHLATARFAAHCRLLHEAGIPLLEALKTGAELTGNAVMARQLLAARERVAMGQPLYAALPKKHAFPGFIVPALKSGETTGQLGAALRHIEDYAASRAREQLATALALLEPALLATLTGIVGLIALSFFLPLFSLLGGVNAR